MRNFIKVGNTVININSIDGCSFNDGTLLMSVRGDVHKFYDKEAAIVWEKLTHPDICDDVLGGE